MCENSRKCEKCGKFSSFLALVMVRDSGTIKPKWLCEKCDLENQEAERELLEISEKTEIEEIG